jgi:hypothetical protein
MKLRHYSHALIALAVFVIAVSLYGVWYAYVGKESAAAVSLASDIETKKQSRERVQEAKLQLEQALSDQQSISGYFVDTDDVVPFLESLQNTGKRLGTTVVVESVSAQPAKPHSVLQLALHITGTFDSVERTLGAIEYQPYDTVVSSVTLDTAGPSAGAVPQWTAAVTLRIGTADAASTTAKTP